MSIRTSILIALALLIGAAIGAFVKSGGGGVVAYYPDGSWSRYVADPSAQVVRSVDVDAAGRISLSTMPACTVVDVRNWICPAATDTGGAPDWRWGAIRAVNGRVESTNPKDVVAPIGWMTWELEKARKLL